MDINSRRALAASALDSLGWGIDSKNINCVGKKDFEILDGIEKQALVWAVPWLVDDVLVIKGEYWSEGDDVLAASMVTFNAAHTKEDVELGIRDFVESIESKIDDSYGRRLRM